ncbi:ATP-dependent DNA helicase pif1-like [Gigaspora margarita]|uniref:ATP-dependent DNA helicase pif1-like n=1 Tax=Gigaspora margarita TaxID=4874 RepID=A0A8H3WXB8_GIGMA|nr:ATP-dependent DNA helicase pif1-like [Gigaspora margarita]
MTLRNKRNSVLRDIKHEKRAAETSEEREVCLTNQHTRYQKHRKQEQAGIENDSNEQINQFSSLNNDEQQVQNNNILEMIQEDGLNIYEQMQHNNIQNTQNSITERAEPHSATVFSKFNINEQMQLNSATIRAEPHFAAVSEFDINEQIQHNSATIRAELHPAAVSEFDINERMQLNSATIHAEPHLTTISGFNINEQMQHNSVTVRAEPHSAAVLSEFDRDLLRKFRTKMDKIKYVFCPVCNENFPSKTLVKGECRRC